MEDMSRKKKIERNKSNEERLRQTTERFFFNSYKLV